MVAVRGGYWMARGWHHTKLSLSSALAFYLFLACSMCVLLLFLSCCRFVLFRCVFFLRSRSSFVDVPLTFFCPADHVPDWQPRILLGMVEARWVNNVKKTTTTAACCVFFPFIPDINGSTSRGHTGGRSHRNFHPPSFCGACLNFSREKESAIPFPRRP